MEAPTGITAGSAATNDPRVAGIIARLDDQLDWYDRKSLAAQRTYSRIKIVEIVAAALIPFLTAVPFKYEKLVTSALAVLITLLEGVLHLNQYQQNWTTYRSTCEALKHEKFLYLAGVGPYKVGDPHGLLAERVESIVSQEHVQWTAVQQGSSRSGSIDAKYV